MYGLYNAVIDTINGYYDIPWVDVNIEKINGDLVDFGNKCRKLPKGLKEYQAFNDLKQVLLIYSLDFIKIRLKNIKLIFIFALKKDN